tara:strand:+ start:1245 stop:1673 length:429 start_codon:yes stop_codon:yes gene_type:complete
MNNVIRRVRHKLVDCLHQEYGVTADVQIDIYEDLEYIDYSNIRFRICLMDYDKNYNYSTQLNPDILRAYSDVGLEPILEQLIKEIVFGFTPLVKIKSIGNNKQQAILFIRDEDSIVRKHCSDVLYNNNEDSYEISEDARWQL